MKKKYVPECNDIAWIDFEPARGKEIGKYRPALILSPKEYNAQTKQLICCPISTSLRGHPMEIIIQNLDKPSAVIANILRTVDWAERDTKFITHAEEGVMTAVLQRLIPLLGADKILLESAGLSR
ncbi:MAG: type II toxin-antitoxin system PemK/MazF family toxin [Gammaproteobacteria bacterium]|nr:type II toxin-antitoxin system PemK/MazF family toxin [Gammaproteobacteria bacterium]